MITYRRYKTRLAELRNDFETAPYDDIRPAMGRIVAFENEHPFCYFLSMLFG